MENSLDKKAKIIETIQKMAGKYSVYEIFGDWVKMMALGFANQVVFKESREKEYLETISRYNEDERNKLVEMLAWLTEWADEEMTDMLGYIYMHLELGSKSAGQFFTPYHICQLMARMQKFDGKTVPMNEPSCGAGGNIIALAEEMQKQGFNYQQSMIVTCQDLDVKAVYMCYTQLTLYGIPAAVFQSDTLCDPEGQKSSTGKLLTFGYIMSFMRDSERVRGN